LLIGLLAGLAHLTRADGILLLPVVALAPLISLRSHTTFRVSRFTLSNFSFLISNFSLLIVGYLLVMLPWFVRNLALIGASLSPAGAKTLWLRAYDWGWLDILRSKLWAVGVNLGRFLAEDCLVFLLPFVLIGLYRLRRRPPFTFSLIYISLTCCAHSLAFTFPGPRGGFFHASAAALPFLYVAGVEGLDAAMGWAARRRRWNLRQARVVFSTAMVVAAVALSAYAVAQKLPAWSRSDEVYLEVGAWLARQGAEDAKVMVANPPAFWYHTGHPAVVVPDDDVETLLDVCERYGVDYLVLDANRPASLSALYEDRALSRQLALAATFEDGLVALWRVGR
jgi:hypothetical protein